MIETELAKNGIKIKLCRDNVFPWYNANEVYAKGYLFAPDGILYKADALCDYFNAVVDEEDFRKKLLEANGLFSVIVKRADAVWVAVDRFRYFPLFYRKQDEAVFISDEVDELFQQGERKVLDEDAGIVYSGVSYVLGNKTLLQGVKQLQAGEMLRVSKFDCATAFYHHFLSEIKSAISYEDAKVHLKKIINDIIKRMSQLLSDRQAVLSLSGGLDSRLLAYMLKKAGKQNVLCYTFGRKAGNPEWEYSKSVADTLGFEWLFIDYTKINAPEFYKEKQFADFYRYESQYVSKFGFMQYFAADYLIKNSKMEQNGVLFQGHGGDFFSGSHLRSYMQKYGSVKTIAKDLQYIHCNLVELTRKERKRISSAIRDSLLAEGDFPLWGNVENWDLKERQAKYIINTNKLWEQLSVEVQMPLCDIELMDFFVSLPFEYRIGQRLYKDVLYELFEEYGLNFLKDKDNLLDTSLKESVKIQIKRLFPFLRKRNATFRYDYFDYERFVQPIMKELGCRAEKIISMNGVFSEWYLMKVKEEINSSM